MNNESKKLGSNTFNELAKDKDLTTLINSILKDLETVKQKDENGYFQHYYETADNLFKLNDTLRKTSSTSY